MNAGRSNRKDFYPIVVLVIVGLVGLIGIILTLTYQMNPSIDKVGYAAGGDGGGGGGNPIGNLSIIERTPHINSESISFRLMVTGGTGTYNNLNLDCGNGIIQKLNIDTTITPPPGFQAFSATCEFATQTDNPYSASASGDDGNVGFISNTLDIFPSLLICTDSDGGLNYTLAGTGHGIPYGTNNYVDISDNCNGAQLTEVYCGADSYLYTHTFNCQNGCFNGACTQVAPPISADMTVSGREYRTNGEDVHFLVTVTGGSPPYSSMMLDCGNGVKQPMSDVINGFAATCSYTVSSSTSYTAVTSGKDSKNTDFDSSIQIIVAPHPPTSITATLSKVSAVNKTTGEDVLYSLALSGGQLPYSGTLSCGDGSNKIMTQSGSDNSKLLATCSYVVTGPTIFQVNASGTDNKGIAFSSNKIGVNVTAHPIANPSATLTADNINPFVGGTVAFTLDTKNVIPTNNPTLNCGNSQVITMTPYPIVADKYKGSCTYTNAGLFNSYATIRYSGGSLNTAGLRIIVRTPDPGNVAAMLSNSANSTQVNQPLSFTLNLDFGNNVATGVSAILICSNTNSVDMISIGAINRFTGSCTYTLTGNNNVYAVAFYTDSLGKLKTATSNSMSITSYIITTPGGGGNGGGGGGSGNNNCVSVWQCSAWSVCSSGFQVRVCTDTAGCVPATIPKPIDSQSCTPGSNPDNQQPEEIPIDQGTPENGAANPGEQPAKLPNKESFFAQKNMYLYGSLFGFIVIGLLVALFVLIKNKNAENELETKLETWVSAKETEGYSRAQLKDFLLRKGYNAKDVNDAVNKARPKAK